MSKQLLTSATKQFMWQSLSWEGLEVLKITTGKTIKAHGVVVGKSDKNIPFAIEYTVMLKNNWRAESVVVTSLINKEKINLVHRRDKWYDKSGNYLSEFDGIEYIDLTISPFTNSLPIKRLPFVNNNMYKIDVIYIDLPNFSLRKVGQYYRKLNNTEYRYQDIEVADFIADITVDDKGIVIDYPGLFKRV